MTRRDLEEIKVRIRLIQIERKNYRTNETNNNYYLELSLRLWKLQAEEKELLNKLNDIKTRRSETKVY